jgi:pimeloyl-ACP methyl ester carboxylesterase
VTPALLSLPDGRRLAWTACGDPAGHPVLAFHGTPACRLMFGPADAAARRLGLRLIAPDRPGYGLSDPQPGRTLRDWSADAARLMDHLGIAAAPILAISGGGPYAVATAAGMPDRIRGLALVSPLGEVGRPGAEKSMSVRDRALLLGLPSRPRLLRAGLRLVRRAFAAAPQAALSLFAATLTAPDRRVLGTPAARELMVAMTREALRPGIEGAVSDLAIFSQPWGIAVASIAAPAVLWQGTDDAMVPAALAFDLARRLPACRTIRLEGEGHFWVLENIEAVIAEVATLAHGGRPLSSSPDGRA